MFIYLVIIIIISILFYFLSTYKKRPKPSKFTPNIHLRYNSDDNQAQLDNLFPGKVKFINSNYDTDMVFLGYIINNWEKLPSKMIFLRDSGWSKKKAIISFSMKSGLTSGLYLVLPVHYHVIFSIDLVGLEYM